MAAGKVLTGFSLPYVALYSASGTTITYSSGQKLARGVSVSISPETADDNKFHADNIAAESAPGLFTGGEITLTVDGLKNAAEKLIMGLPAPTATTVGSASVDVYEYGDSMEIPYVGIAFIARYQEDGVQSYVPVLLPKCRFSTAGMEAATQEEEIDWQTQELTASIFRDDSANHVWKKVAEDQESESEAEAVIKALLSIT